MSHPAQFSRREFLKTSAQTAGALILGFSLPTRAQVREPASGGPFKVFQPNAWLRITADNQITILVEKPELGQGSRTYTPMMIAEELEVDWSTIHVEQAPTIPSIYQGLRTGGSGGVASTFTPMRQVGAQARVVLITAAAQQWKAKKRDCRAENGTVVHGPTNRHLSYGELVETASELPLINPDEITLKQPKDFRFIGKPIPRTDLPSKVDGSATFGIDVRVPGMLFAVIALSLLRWQAAELRPICGQDRSGSSGRFSGSTPPALLQHGRWCGCGGRFNLGSHAGPQSTCTEVGQGTGRERKHGKPA
jgi:isoquinoline 1-oxidoreductase beta subunit